MASVMFSFILAMMLRILPLPMDWFAWNPDWLALLLIYWTLLAPDRVGIVTAWLVGFFADVLTGRLFGQHALAYAVMAYSNLQTATEASRASHAGAVRLGVVSLIVGASADSVDSANGHG